MKGWGEGMVQRPTSHARGFTPLVHGTLGRIYTDVLRSQPRPCWRWPPRSAIPRFWCSAVLARAGCTGCRAVAVGLGGACALWRSFAMDSRSAAAHRGRTLARADQHASACDCRRNHRLVAHQRLRRRAICVQTLEPGHPGTSGMPSGVLSACRACAGGCLPRAHFAASRPFHGHRPAGRDACARARIHAGDVVLYGVAIAAFVTGWIGYGLLWRVGESSSALRRSRLAGAAGWASYRMAFLDALTQLLAGAARRAHGALAGAGRWP